MKRLSKYQVHLTDQERQTLEAFVASGRRKAREITRARILLYADAGRKDREIVQLLGVSRQTVSSMRQKACQQTEVPILDILQEAPRPGRPIHIDSRVEAKISMLACSQPPQGAAQWTLQMIADKLVELNVVHAISLERVRQTLQRSRLKPWLREQGCLGRITGTYLWHLEDGLFQYAQPHDPLRPLVCFDERPCFLIEDVRGILPMSAGKVKRYHYEYAKNGSCCVFLAFEPHTGWRYVQVRARRTAVDDAQFMQQLFERYEGRVECVRLVQDNLNTHTPGAFFEILPAHEAFALGASFEMHYTPKKGSWLNMAEIELAALSKQCLDRRIPDVDQMRQEVLAWAAKRNQQRVTVDWQFAQSEARGKLKRHYDNVKKLN